jgi:hypothetical protein
MVTKSEWDVIKNIHGNKCVICEKTERQVGILEKAHIKSAKKGGTQVLPMCPTCHKMYDDGKLSATKLKKIGLDVNTAKKLCPPKKKSSQSKSISYPWF